MTGAVNDQSNDIWERVPQHDLSQRDMTKARIVVDNESDPAFKPISSLRTQLMQVMISSKFRSVAVSSPTDGCGSTFLSMNLAFSIARQRKVRVMLVDLANTAGSFSKLLGLTDAGVAAKTVGLSGSVPEKVLRLRPNLLVGFNTTTLPITSESLQDLTSGGIAERISKSMLPDVIIFDLPPILGSDATIGFMPQVDGVLLVADGTTSKAENIKECEKLLRDRTQLIGVVLNRADGA